MFSLRTKLTLALLVTGLAAASIVGAVAQWELRQKFSAAVMTQSFEAFKSDVAEYFTTYGTWENGEASEPFGEFVSRRHAFAAGPPRGNGPISNPLVPPAPRSDPASIPPVLENPRGGRGGPRGGAEQPPFRFLLLDTEGRVLLPNPPYQRGEVAPPSLRGTGMSISAGGRQVAIAVPMDAPNLSERDGAYLTAMRQALFFGIGVAAVIAVILGLVFGTTLSRTLRRLTSALRAVAAGDLHQHVETKSHDETGILAEAFNRMSTDLAKSTEDLQQSNERVRAQAEQLEHQNERLREAVKLREEVDRIARHDLKTPLGTVIGVPRLLREENRLGPEADELLGIVERAGYRILNMVNLSLDLYKIEQGTYRVRPQILDVSRLLQTVMSDVASLAAANRVTMRVMPPNENGGGSTPVQAWAEELLCYSLLANLLKNAVEASAEGGEVSITVRQARGIVIDIHNDGAVPDEIRERLFEKYATAGKAGGSGLGTYSARMMARVQGGDITMTSSSREGTTVSVRLPDVPAAVAAAQAGLKPEEERIAASSPASAMPALRVLLVDDDEYNRLVLSRYLGAPLVVTTAVNGRDAVEAAVAQQPDVILMDVDMPGMDGLEASRTVRQREDALGRHPCVIIALSSFDDDSTRQRSQAAGCNLYLTKPVTRTALQAAIRDVARSRDTSHTNESAPQPAVVLDPDTKDLLPAFIESRRVLLDEIDLALGTGDFAQLRRSSHRLAGSLGLYGFHWASGQARRLEIEAQNGNRAVIVELLTALRHHLDTVEIRSS